MQLHIKIYLYFYLFSGRSIRCEHCNVEVTSIEEFKMHKYNCKMNQESEDNTTDRKRNSERYCYLIIINLSLNFL